jgi:hypothetical protein
MVTHYSKTLAKGVRTQTPHTRCYSTSLSQNFHSEIGEIKTYIPTIYMYVSMPFFLTWIVKYVGLDKGIYYLSLNNIAAYFL